MARGKDYQLSEAISMLQIRVNELTQQRIEKKQIIDALHISITETAELLAEVNLFDLGATATITPSGDICDVSALNIQNCVKIVDATNGLCLYKDEKELPALVSSPQKKANVYWTRRGTNIHLYKGDLSAYGTLTLYYTRYPVKATADADYLDIKDTYLPMVLDKAKLHLYEQLRIKPPVSLENTVNNNIARIRKAYQKQIKTKGGNVPGRR